MPEMLSKEAASDRTLRKKNRLEQLIGEMPPNPSTPKELHVATHRMLSGDNMVANLSRAVIQNVRDSDRLWSEQVSGFVETSWSSFAEYPEDVTILIVQPDASKSEVIDSSRTFQELSRQLNVVFREAQAQGKATEVAESLDEWIASYIESPRRPDSEFFLDQAKRLAERGNISSALDIIYDQIDEMLLAGDYGKVDQLLGDVSPNSLTVDLLLGILTVTLPAKEHLSNRSAFLHRVEDALRQRDELKEGLLVGLD